MIRKAKDNKNYITSEKPFPTYVFEAMSDKNFDSDIELAYEKTYHLVDKANEDLKEIANNITSKYETKDNTNELDLVRDMFKISVKDGYNFGFSMILEFDDIYFEGVTEKQKLIITNHIQSHALMLMREIANKVGLTTLNKSYDSKDQLKITDMIFAEDKQIMDPNYPLNEFFGIIQVGLKDIDQKDIKVTKDDISNYSVKVNGNEIARIKNNGVIWFDDTIYGRYTSLRQVKEKKEEIKNILNSPNMKYFKIEEVRRSEEELAQERQQAWQSVRGSQTGKIKNFLLNKTGKTEADAIDVTIGGELFSFNNFKEFNDFLKNRFFTYYNRFGLGIAKFILNGDLEEKEPAEAFEMILPIILEEADKLNENFDGLTIEELSENYASEALNKEEKMLEELRKMKRTESRYTVHLIDSYEKSKAFNKDTFCDSPWCTTYREDQWNRYQKGGADVFYYLLRDDFESVKPVEERSKRKYLDNYATSMIAVSIKKNGLLNNVTSRYNHAIDDDESGREHEHAYSEKEISEFLGRPFYEVLKPLNPEDLKTEFIDETKTILQKGVKVLDIGDRRILQYNGDYVVMNIKEKKLITDTKKRVLKFNKILKVFKSNTDRDIIGFLFYMKKDDIVYVIGFDKNMNTVMNLKPVFGKELEIKKLKEMIEKHRLERGE